MGNPYNLRFRQVDPNSDLIQVVSIITKYYSGFTFYMPKTEVDIRMIFNSPDFSPDSSFMAFLGDKAVGFVGSLFREVDGDYEGEIIGLSTTLEPDDELFYIIIKHLLDLSIEALEGKGAARISTIATPQFTYHYRLLTEYGFRPIKAWYLMKVNRNEIRFPRDMAKDLRILPYKDLGKERGSKLDLVLSLLNAAFFGELGGGWDESELFLKFRDPTFDPDGVFIGFYKDTPVGLVWVLVDEHLSQLRKKKIGWVALLGLRKEYRGRKFGRTILIKGLEYLLKNGVDEILLWVDSENFTAVRLYRMFNFGVERSSYLMWYLPKR